MTNELIIVKSDKASDWTITDADSASGNPPTKFHGYVYALEWGDWIKIGKTKNIAARVKQLNLIARYGDVKIGRIAFSVPHTNYSQNENILHRHFATRRYGVTEIFHLSLESFFQNIPALTFEDNSAELKKKCDHASESLKAIVEKLWAPTNKDMEFDRTMYKFGILVCFLTSIIKMNDESEALRLLDDVLHHIPSILNPLVGAVIMHIHVRHNGDVWSDFIDKKPDFFDYFEHEFPDSGTDVCPLRWHRSIMGIKSNQPPIEMPIAEAV